MSNKTRDFFNEYSSVFRSIYQSSDNILVRLFNKLFRKSMWIRFYKTIQESKTLDNMTVLDIGCGPGLYSICLAKQGAVSVLGIDFAHSMIELAQKTAQEELVDMICKFEVIDFNLLDESNKYDYVVIMGVMDYIQDSLSFVEKVAKHTKCKAVFSFPISGGLLAWQRKLRYKFKCPLFLYSLDQLNVLFSGINNFSYRIEKIHRDFFIVMEKQYETL